ncbi:MAG: hypothetical protein HYV27_14860 [Candidatus Hydrogenedentes bacterium]|nr:hypothetical protein [Candidatus Hydrogenedentota bacterium]
MSEKETIIQAVRDSECFKAEVIYAERGGYKIALEPRLYKVLEDDLVRVVFPAAPSYMEEGTVLAVTCLYDRAKGYNIYGHTICAGAGVNVLLRAVYAPLGGAHPQSGNAGPKAIMKFTEVKKGLWGRFYLEDLELGNAEAGARYVRGFWKALDRMFGGGVLMNVPEDWHWKGD